MLTNVILQFIKINNQNEGFVFMLIKLLKVYMELNI